MRAVLYYKVPEFGFGYSSVVYKQIWEGEVDIGGPAGAEEIFTKFNIGDRGNLKCRSMACDDIVMIVDRYFRCLFNGWKDITETISVERGVEPGTSFLTF